VKVNLADSLASSTTSRNFNLFLYTALLNSCKLLSISYISSHFYFNQPLLKLFKQTKHLIPSLAFPFPDQYFQHVPKFVQTDELMFAMQFINAGQTAQSFGLALFFETKHDNLFLFVIWPFVAVMCRDVHV